MSRCASGKIGGAEDVFFVIEIGIDVISAKGVVSRCYDVRARVKDVFGIILTDAVYLRGVFTVDDDKVGAEVILYFSEIRAQICNACLPDDISDCKYFSSLYRFLEPFACRF